jgi:hypothetical protein
LKLVYEDEYGGYLGVRKEFLKEFVLQENNPNFEVYNSRDKQRRFVAVKSSRVPDDEDLTAGKFGIDFNRAKPTLQEALRYKATLPQDYQILGDIAFAAASEEEYTEKSAIWDSFYSYIWGETPKTVWVAPHSGSVNRLPDDIIPFPKLWTDTSTAGVAALCAYRDKGRVSKRIMVYVHATGLMGAVINPGDFGILDNNKMDAAAVKIEKKYHKKVQVLAEAFKQDYCLKSLNILEHINKRRGTLNPDELKLVSKDDYFAVTQHEKALKLHGQKINEFTIYEFREAFHHLGKIEIPVISNNYPYSARHVGELLKMREKISQGLMDSALSVECAKLYAARNPVLVADIILDIKHALFG